MKRKNLGPILHYVLKQITQKTTAPTSNVCSC